MTKTARLKRAVASVPMRGKSEEAFFHREDVARTDHCVQVDLLWTLIGIILANDVDLV